MEEFEFTRDLVNNFDNLFGDQELCDFIIKVENRKIPCHRFVLAAASEFFRALFRSGMREATEGIVTFNDISFRSLKSIINSMYTGKITLSFDSFMDIWRTADLLQVDFIKKACEKYAIHSLTVENLNRLMNETKQYLNTELKIAFHKFMLKNFDAIAEINGFIEISLEDLLVLIESKDLNASSEDFVLEIIIKWIENVPIHYCCIDDTDLTRDFNSDYEIRRKALVKLLQALRLALVSLPVLKELQKHELVKNHKILEELISQSIMNKVTNSVHGQWRTNGLHRSSSDYDHYGVVFDSRKQFVILSAYDESFYSCAGNAKLAEDVSLASFGLKMYASGCKHARHRNSTLWVLNGHVWKRVADLPGRELLLVSYDDAIYIFNTSTCTVSRIYPAAEKIRAYEFAMLPVTIKILHVMAFSKGFLIFSALHENGVDKTRVHYLNALTKNVKEFDPIFGPCEHIISFSDDQHTFVLQKNGNLFDVSCMAKKIKIEKIGKLWELDRVLYGALTYLNKLVVYGSDPKVESEQQIFKINLSGYFKKIKYFGSSSESSNFLPATLSKNVILPLKQ